MITINKSATERSIYNATRYAWKLSKVKAEQAEYVCAVIQGIIVEVLKPYEWKSATLENFPEFGFIGSDRLAFIGKIAEESVRSLYFKKRVPMIYRKKGAANPVKYSFQ